MSSADPVIDYPIPAGPTGAELTRALVCLTKFGDEIDVSCSVHQVKLSSVNSSRSAFGLFVLNKSFFSKYNLTRQHYHSNLAFSVTAKASNPHYPGLELSVANI